jgi:hypothetical protein
MDDQRNNAVKLTLAGQDLVQHLNAGRYGEAAELAEQAADLAAHIADELEAVGSPGP